MAEEFGGHDVFLTAHADEEAGVVVGNGFERGRPGIEDGGGSAGVGFFSGEGPMKGVGVGRGGVSGEVVGTNVGMVGGTAFDVRSWIGFPSEGRVFGALKIFPGAYPGFLSGSDPGFDKGDTFLAVSDAGVDEFGFCQSATKKEAGGREN